MAKKNKSKGTKAASKPANKPIIDAESHGTPTVIQETNVSDPENMIEHEGLKESEKGAETKTGTIIENEDEEGDSKITIPSDKTEEMPITSDEVKPEKKNKRLTLQERLELAAQKKSKAKEAKKENKTEKLEIESKQFESAGTEPTKKEENTVLEPKELKDILGEEVALQQPDIIEKIEKYIALKMSNIEKPYKDRISKLEKDLTKKSISANEVTEGDLVEKLKTKDEQIRELLDEGNKLSKKEVQLNQLIKKLKTHETELETELEHLESKNEELSSKVESLEGKVIQFDKNTRLLAEEKLAHETLRKKFDSLMIAKDSLTDELKEIRFSKLDVQLEASQKELKEKEIEFNKLKEKYEKLEINLKNKENETSAIIKELEMKLKENEELSNDRNQEIKRLEENVEKLRFDNENIVPTTNANNNNDIIQQQYEEAQENWKLIESSYLKKINSFENQIDEIQELNISYSKKIKILTNDLKQKSIDYSKLEEQNQTIENSIGELEKQNKSLSQLNKTLENNLEKIRIEFDKEKDIFEKKIQTLEQEKESMESRLKLRSNEFNTVNPPNTNNFYLQDLSSSSSLMKSMNTPSINRGTNNKRYSVQLGEVNNYRPNPPLSSSNSTFSFSRLNNMQPMTPQDRILRHQNSIVSFDSIDNENVVETGDVTLDNEGPLGIKVNHHSLSSFITDSPNFNDGDSAFMLSNDEIGVGMDAETENGMNTPIIESSDNHVGKNIQIMNKLASQLRILELEVHTLREDSKRLEEEKEAASNEIVKLMNDNEKVNEIRKEVKERDSKIETLEENYQKVLIILGEKEERIGELDADVDDLKDLLRQQVQQMVEMQEKINSMSNKK